ncbi:MAG: efflux RND transporter periplasmic adaptor subunit [Polaribacter sp.]|nr:efflux RND transporter periplasmic adaptor subunit [Polaribacter sp.]
MKNIYTLIIATVFLISCGEKKEVSVAEIIATNDIVKIKAKKAELEAHQQGLTAQLSQLSEKLDALDTHKKTPLVSTFLAKEEVFVHYLELQGSVQTKQNVLVYPEMPGILELVYVKEGQSVKKGEVLATINDGGLSQKLTQLETQTALAKTIFERQKRLWSQKIGSEIQYLQSKANYETQANAIEQLKKQLKKAVVSAPFDGVIDAVFKEEGTVVAPGRAAEIFRIVNLSNMYISTDVPERYIASIKKNKKVRVNFPILGESVHSTIRQVGSFINPNNRSFKIEVPVANKSGNIKPNLTARLHVNDYTNHKAILIPQSIISENAKGEQFIYVVKNKKANKEAVAQRVIIKTGKTQGDVIEVLANLPVGTEIIQEGARSVNNGQTLRVIINKTH